MFELEEIRTILLRKYSILYSSSLKIENQLTNIDKQVVRLATE